MRTDERYWKMKSQDFLLLFKLVSLHAYEENLIGQMELESDSNSIGVLLNYGTARHMVIGDPVERSLVSYPGDSENNLFNPSESETDSSDNDSWKGWDDAAPITPLSNWSERYSLRALSAAIGLSKSEVSNSLARCREAGLLTNDFGTGLPKANFREILKITQYALKFFFPVKPGAIVRGIPTGFAAPALSKSLKSAGGMMFVWPDPLGKEQGQAISPLYKTVPESVKQDRVLYHYLALVDAIRLGGPRESDMAINILKAGMGLK